MTKRRNILVLIVVPAIASVLVTLLILSIWDKQRASQPTTIVLPTHSGTALIPPRATQPPPPQSDEPVGSDETTQEPGPITPTSSCENPVHLVASGETLGVIAEQYGVSIDDLVIMNQMLDPEFDPDFLAVRQELTVPICGVPTPTPTGEPTGASVPTRNVPTPIPTTTDLPAGAISVSIVRVLHPGDITREAVEIVNEGSPVDLDGWRLTNGEGDEFVFPSFRLFTGGGVTIFTGAGEDTAIVLYWGLNNAVWEVGYTVSLYDVDGKLRDEFEITE
ncbi:MAG: lamin tail domain-containing protein [Anaerolineae bacterium]|nr:lamin tail domain-containing protein [Anaerolineae bacterium]